MRDAFVFSNERHSALPPDALADGIRYDDRAVRVEGLGEAA